jgi:hypothetical protein
LRFGLRPKSESPHAFSRVKRRLRPSAEERIPSWECPSLSSFGAISLPEGFAFRFSIFSAERESQGEGFALWQAEREPRQRRVHEYLRCALRCKPRSKPVQTPCEPLLLLDSRSTLIPWHSGIAS